VLIVSAFFFSVFFNHRRTALIVGYFFMIGIALVCAVLLETVLENPTTVSHTDRFAISLPPSFAVYRGLMYLADKVSWKGPGYR
jgi:hypothetical protein